MWTRFFGSEGGVFLSLDFGFWRAYLPTYLPTCCCDPTQSNPSLRPVTLLRSSAEKPTRQQSKQTEHHETQKHSPLPPKRSAALLRRRPRRNRGPSSRHIVLLLFSQQHEPARPRPPLRRPRPRLGQAQPRIHDDSGARRFLGGA